MIEMKKENIKTAVIIILLLVVVFGGSFFASELSGKDSAYSELAQSSSGNEIEEEEIPEEEQGDFNEIGIDEYLSLKKGSDKSIIFIARPGCSWCQLYTPIMKNVVYLYHIEVNHLNTDELSDDENTQLIKSDDYFADGYGTPLTLIVQDNKIVDKIEGYTSKESTIEFFKNNGLISE